MEFLYSESYCSFQALKVYGRQGLQIIMDHGFRHMIAERESLKAAGHGQQQDLRGEKNVIRYMSGYVAVKLLKKYRKGNVIISINDSTL